MPNLNYSELFETLNSVFIDSKFSRTSLNPQNKFWCDMCINEVFQENALNS